MLELLLLSICLGSNLNDSACNQSWEKTKTENPSIDDRMKMYERTYEKDLPVGLIWLGSAAGMVYKKEVKFGLGHGYYADIRDQGTALLGVKVSFP